MKEITVSGELIYADQGRLVHQRGDELTITHVRDVEPVMAQVAAIRDQSNNGFSKVRHFRYLGSVPLSTLLARPELADDNELKKYLRERPRLRAVGAHTF